MLPPDEPAHSKPSFVEPEGARGRPAAGAAEPPLDAATLERVRSRDPEALGLLYERYFDRVYALVYRLLGERSRAEDAASEVFLKVYRSAHQLDATRDPAPWLMTIATNVCRDLWRSGAYRMTQRATSVEDEGVADRLPSHGSEPEKDLLAAEREQIVQQSLLELPEPLRTAIVLHDYQGMNHQEIAAITGIEHAAARKRYSRALGALAQRLRERFR